MTDTMIKPEVLPKEYFAPFAPLTKEFFDVFELTDRLFTRPRFFVEGMALPLRIEQFTEENYLIMRAELPGVDPEKDVPVTFEEGGVELGGLTGRACEAAIQSRIGELLHVAQWGHLDPEDD